MQFTLFGILKIQSSVRDFFKVKNLEFLDVLYYLHSQKHSEFYVAKSTFFHE